jgi:hypothetical protein
MALSEQTVIGIVLGLLGIELALVVWMFADRNKKGPKP